MKTRSLEQILAAPETRQQALRYCVRLSRNREAAEDLAQETLIEAWRHRDSLRAASAWQSWLYGIARNVVLRWRRRVGIESSRYTPLGEEHLSLVPVVDGGADVLAREEWGEVSGLIADAIGHLPAHTGVLVAERFLEEQSVEEVARRHGLTENAVRVRLHRGRQQLQNVFRTRFRVEADALGLLPDRAGENEETRIWCPYCGACKLRGYFDTTPGRERFALDCPGCTAKPGCTSIGVAFTSRQATLPVGEVLGGVRMYRPALRRVQAWWGQHFRHSLQQGRGPCLTCGRPVPLEYVEDRNGARMVKHCPTCRHVYQIPPRAFALMLPDVQEFWQRNPRVRTVPTQRVRLGLTAAFLTRFESITSSARCTVVTTALFEPVSIETSG